jgi:hypothetical protein
MRMRILSISILFALLAPTTISLAGEKAGSATVAAQADHLPHHHLAIFVGYGSETKSGHEDENGFALGLEWEYRFHEKWGPGAVVEVLGQDTIRDVILVVPISFHPGGHWRLFAGPGIEFTSKKDKFAFRLGAGYEIPIGSHWSLAPEIYVDLIESGENTWVGGLALGYEF